MGETTIFVEMTAKATNTTTDSPNTGLGELAAVFWCVSCVFLCVAVVNIFGNGLVIYAACGNRNTGRLRYLDDVIKSLAVSDMLFGILGCPLFVYANYLGRC